jgi:hypothetical protein
METTALDGLTLRCGACGRGHKLAELAWRCADCGGVLDLAGFTPAVPPRWGVAPCSRSTI